MSTDSQTSMAFQTDEYHADAKPARSLEAHDVCRVLVVEDDPLVRARICTLVREHQFHVEVASTGREALRILGSIHCDIVLTDWLMPDMDGLALCRHVRLLDDGGYVYLMMLTVRGTERDMLAGLAAGADAYLVKGASFAAIRSHLDIGRRICRRRRAPGAPRLPAGAGVPPLDAVPGIRDLDYLVEHLPRELERAKRYNHPLAVLSAGIDGYDAICGQFGVGTGEEVARLYMSECLDCIRSTDWISQSGAGEFVVVLPETPATGAHRVAEKLRQLFVPHPLSSPAEPRGFAVDFCLTTIDPKGETDGMQQVGALLREAARAKHAGERSRLQALDTAAMTLCGAADGATRRHFN